eukprot:TRINITY_DN27675_c0_g1_i1.p1 TRINITY_DN27675_c0_g1~~TRINITY_DN27675_c0_g1_i1.p1  ORF type:complete len:567 (-),score=95.94 TRINITY_DN27675_c0_g1_i1:104-1804(-)
MEAFPASRSPKWVCTFKATWLCVVLCVLLPASLVDSDPSNAPTPAPTYTSNAIVSTLQVTNSPSNSYTYSDIALWKEGGSEDTLFVTSPDAHAVFKISASTGEAVVLAGGPAVNVSRDGLHTVGVFSNNTANGTGFSSISGISVNRATQVSDLKLFVSDGGRIRILAPYSAHHGAAEQNCTNQTNQSNCTNQTNQSSQPNQTNKSNQSDCTNQTNPPNCTNQANCTNQTNQTNTTNCTNQTNQNTQSNHQVIVSTLAGSDELGFVDGNSTTARFNGTSGIATDAAGNVVFVVDTKNNAVRQVVVATGEVSTVAGGTLGSADGIGTNASFNSPIDVAIDQFAGNHSNNTVLYVTDAGNHRIRKIDVRTKAVSTLAGNATGYADGVGRNASFGSLFGISYAESESSLFVTDSSFHSVRRVAVSDGTVVTSAGTPQISGIVDGTGNAAQFGTLFGISAISSKLFALDQSGWSQLGLYNSSCGTGNASLSFNATSLENCQALCLANTTCSAVGFKDVSPFECHFFAASGESFSNHSTSYFSCYEYKKQHRIRTITPVSYTHLTLPTKRIV